MDGRARRKIEAMRRAQAAALDLFEARGYDGTTVEQIADAAEVGAATIYRAFGTKERIILWDEYDPLLFEAIAARLEPYRDRLLPTLPVADAVLEALASTLGRLGIVGPMMIGSTRLQCAAFDQQGFQRPHAFAGNRRLHRQRDDRPEQMIDHRIAEEGRVAFTRLGAGGERRR